MTAYTAHVRIALLLGLVLACHEPAKVAQPAPPPPVVVTPPPPVEAPQNLDLDSADILARTETADVLVKDILISWQELAPAFRGKLDPRSEGRTQAEAAKLTETIANKLRANHEQLAALIQLYSEDPGSSGEPYAVNASSSFVPEFIKLATRLHLDEVGVVRSQYGYHVLIRVAPPPPDPLESTEILARPEQPGPVLVQHILIGWDQTSTRDPRGKGRTKAQADDLARQVLLTVRTGGDMAILMKEYSEDPGSNTSAKPYEVTTKAPMVEPFKRLSLRLTVGEAGLVKTVFGWHIVKRVPPPPPDKLESADILARAPVTQSAKVLHILLGWSDVHAADPRGQKRTRRELDKLVATTLAKLKQGTRFEALMEQLSEDPGSAKTGHSYDVTPEAALVTPFKELSLRLKVNEVGVVKTDFGIHIIKRIE
jgi:parvulin-like peptidyl-prolyl isomerase